MRFYQREIIISLLALIVTSTAIGYFLKGVATEKKVMQSDLYVLVDSAPTGLLVVNKPATFNRMILSQEEARQIFARFIPEIYLDIIRQIPALSSVLFAFHDKEIVMYVRADEQMIRRLDNNLLKRRFPIYTPYTQEKEGVRFTFYPDTANRFFGCYLHQHIWVASYSKRLLEQAAKRQLHNSPPTDRSLTRLLQSLDHQAPLNLLCPSQSLNLYVAVNDSTNWRIQGEWLAADVYSDQGKLCCIGNLTYHFKVDSLYAPLADSLNRRLQQIFPGLQIQTHADIDQEQVYITSCGLLTDN